MAVFHGGNLARAASEFGIALEDWLDLSTGINPNPYPVGTLTSDSWHRLPDQGRLNDLINEAARFYRVSSPEYVIPVSGTQTLLQILPHLFERPKKVRVIGPTYKEHAYCWKLAGHDVVETPDLETASVEADILILVNPNNPTGRTYTASQIVELANAQHAKGGLLIVDGAFVECHPELDVSSHVGMNGLMVLRSFGKFFGLAGIRLGFVLASGSLAQRLKDGIGPWAVNGPAIEIGCQAFADVDWAKKARQELANAAHRLDGILRNGGLGVVGGTSLFRYCSHEDAQGVYRHLAENGILVRPFEDQPQHLRFGLPGDEAGWQKLINVLKIL